MASISPTITGVAFSGALGDPTITASWSAAISGIAMASAIGVVVGDAVDETASLINAGTTQYRASLTLDTPYIARLEGT